MLRQQQRMKLCGFSRSNDTDTQNDTLRITSLLIEDQWQHDLRTSLENKRMRCASGPPARAMFDMLKIKNIEMSVVQRLCFEACFSFQSCNNSDVVRRAPSIQDRFDRTRYCLREIPHSCFAVLSLTTTPSQPRCS